MHHAKISEWNQCQSRFRSPICDYIIRSVQPGVFVFSGEHGACIINNENDLDTDIGKEPAPSLVRNGVEVETRETQRVAAASRLTQLFQLSGLLLLLLLLSALPVCLLCLPGVAPVMEPTNDLCGRPAAYACLPARRGTCKNKP